MVVVTVKLAMLSLADPFQMEKEFSHSDKYETDWDFTRKHTTVRMLFKAGANRGDKPDDHGKHITDEITSSTASADAILCHTSYYEPVLHLSTSLLVMVCRTLPVKVFSVAEQFEEHI